MQTEKKEPYVINRKIVSFNVVKEEDNQKSSRLEVNNTNNGDISHNRRASDNVTTMNEEVERDSILMGNTYKIKPPTSSALYVTINDMVLNPGTPEEHRVPFEIFINSKEMEHFQWVVALTRVVSAVFRKGGDLTFLTEELKSVFDPRGGYFVKGGRFSPSLVAEIGIVIEKHLIDLNLIPDNALDEHQRALIADKRKAYNDSVNACEDEPTSFPANSQLCQKCHTKAVIMMDGCMTCLSCGDSKCG